MAYKYLLDIHTHSIASGHAYGTIREMAQVASERGLKLLGISEHGPGMPGTFPAIYFCNLGVVPRFLYGVEVLFGCEANVLDGGKVSLDEENLSRLDYAIVGIHGPVYHDMGREKNTDNLIGCMKHPKVSFVSHPDDDHTPLNYERLVRAAKEYHVALEVNNSSFYKPDFRWNFMENYRTMLALCKELQVPIVVDSDAHDPSWVGESAEALKLLEMVDFPEELLLNADVDRLKKFIGYEGPEQHKYVRGKAKCW